MYSDEGIKWNEEKLLEARVGVEREDKREAT